MLQYLLQRHFHVRWDQPREEFSKDGHPDEIFTRPLNAWLWPQFELKHSIARVFECAAFNCVTALCGAFWSKSAT